MSQLMITNRIKYYRELLNITQKELCRDVLALPTIKAIESKSNKLNIKTASIIANNLNFYAEEKGIKLNITAAELMKPAKVCAREFCLKELSVLEGFQDKIEDYIILLQIAEEYKLYDILCKINSKIGDYYKSIKEFSKGISYYEKCISLYSNLNNEEKVGELLNSIGSCYYSLGQYKISLKYYEDSLDKIRGLSKSNNILLGKINYNIALTFNKLKKFEKSLEYLEEFTKLNILNKEYLFRVSMLKGNIYYRLNKINEALEVYEVLLEDHMNNQLLNFNMSLIYSSLGNQEKSMEYLNRTIELQMKNINDNLTVSLVELGQRYENEKNFKGAISCYENAIRNAVHFKQENQLIMCYELLYDIYKEKNVDYLESNYLKSIYTNLNMLTKDSDVKARMLMILIKIIVKQPNEMISIIVNKIEGDINNEKD